MHVTSAIIVPAVALLGMIQYCPAPPAIAAIGAAAGAAAGAIADGAAAAGGAIADGVAAGASAVAGASAATVGATAGVIGAAGSVAGAVEGAVAASRSHKRDTMFFSRINRRADLSNLGLGTAWPDCMNELHGSHLNFDAPDPSTVTVSGLPPACMTLCTVVTGKLNEGNPVPMSSNSVKFTNLSAGDLQEIQNALNAHPNYQH